MTIIPLAALEALSETDNESYYEFDSSDFFDTSTNGHISDTQESSSYGVVNHTQGGSETVKYVPRQNTTVASDPQPGVPLNDDLFQPAEESGSSQNDEYLGGEDYVDLGDIGELLKDENFRNALLSGAKWPSALDSPPSIQVTGPSPSSTTFARQHPIDIHGAQISPVLPTPSKSAGSHTNSYTDTIKDTTSVTSSRNTSAQPDTRQGTKNLSQLNIQIETPETLRHRFYSESPVQVPQGRVRLLSNTSERTVYDAEAEHAQPGERSSSVISDSTHISQSRASSNRKGKRKRDPEPDPESSPEPIIVNPPIVPSMGFGVPVHMSNTLEGPGQYQNPPVKRQRSGIAYNTRSQHQEPAPVDIPIDPQLLQQKQISQYHARQARPTLVNYPNAHSYYRHRQMGELMHRPAAINPAPTINDIGPTQDFGYYPQQAFGNASQQWAISKTGAAYLGSSTTGNAVASSSRVRLDEQGNHWEYVGEFADISRTADARGLQIPSYNASSPQAYYAHGHGRAEVTHANTQARGVNANDTNSRRPQKQPHSSRKGKEKKRKPSPIPSEPAKMKRTRRARDARVANIPETRCILDKDELTTCKYHSCGMQTTYEGAQSHLQAVHDVKSRSFKGGELEQCLNCKEYFAPCSLGRHITEKYMPGPYYKCGVPGCDYKNKRKYLTSQHYLQYHYPINPGDPFP